MKSQPVIRHDNSDSSPGDRSRYHLDMTTRRELRSIRVQLAKEEGVLRELKRGADIGGLGNASVARDIEHSEREVDQLRAKLKKLKGRV
jgi:hypothetical protein